MSCLVDYSTVSKCDSFLHSQKLHYKTTPTCLPKGEGHTEENYFEIGQREFRKVPVRKKISFKVKKSSSCYRRNIDSHKKICINSNHVAQLTQKFNDIVAENTTASIPTKTPHLDTRIKSTKHQIHNINGKHITLYRKPSLDNALVIIKTKPVIKENSVKKQSSVKEDDNVHNRIISAKNSTKEEPQERSTTPDVGDNVKHRLYPQNNNNNMVQAKIEIFERKSFGNEENSRRPKIETAQVSSRIPALAQILQTPNITKVTDETDTNRTQIEVTNESKDVQKPAKTLEPPTVDKSKLSFLEKGNEESNTEKVQIPQRKCESMYETIIPGSTLDPYKSKSFGAITSLDIPIKPNNSFLWSDKSPTRCYSTMKSNRRSEGGDALFISMLNNQPAPELPPKPKSSPKTVETFNPHYESFAEIQPRSSKSLERKSCSNLENVDEGYELLNTDSHTEENIYEAMSSVRSTPDKKTSSLKSYSQVKDNEDTKSNFYEKIYSKSGKKNGDNESIYESVYESTISCSNRDSLTSEQNSNSLYGKNLWEQEDDASTYKAISEISDEWVDVSDNEEEGRINSGVIIIHEKQKSKKSSWSQHLRGQWAKSDPPLSVTADSDSDHHYESLYTAYEQQDDDYDSFESDSESEKSVDKRKSGESFTGAQHNQLPKPPNAQPYGLIKFAGKHMKKLKSNFSIDLSKSLSRMTKRISRTDLSLPNSIKDEKPQPIMTQYKVTETQEVSRSSTSTIGAIYQNVEFSKVLPPKPSDEKERLSFLKKIRRSMSMSTESALELTANLANKRRSTFYLTETIDIDKNENDEFLIDNSTISSTLSKPTVQRPRSPPPPAPVKIIDQKKNNDIRKISLAAEDDVIKNNSDPDNQTTFWYAEIDLYRSPQNTPSTSTAENSGSNTSYTIKSSESINQDVEDYYNMKNKNDHSIEVGDKSDGNESNEDESFTNVTPDIQLLLQDEPLYQFYDAAVLESVCRDGVSEIDSDTYEEIDEDNISEVSSNRPSAMELVLPNKNTISFTKTLWCEIPEVTQSSVLGKLSAKQKKLQEAKFEIITSEASYLNSLNVLHDHFASNIRKFVSEKEWEILFGKVIAVRTCSERMLQELEKCWQDNILLYGICDIVQKEAEENFYVYIHYCENQILLGGTLKQIMKKPGFTEFLKNLESSASCQFLTLYSFLMLPMQRITRWPLLVDAVLKRLSQSDPEYLVCQYALSSLNKIVNQCNEAARRKEREIELQNISMNLEFAKDVAPINIVLPNRWLVRSGVVTNIQPKNDDSKMTFGKRFNKVQLYLYLFNDLFLVTKEKSCGTYTVLHYCPRNLVELNNSEVLLFPKKDCPEKNLLFLTILENQEGKTVEFLLSCNKESDKERWIEAITPPKSEDPEETLYECWDCPQVTAIHNYNGIQPDELTLARGDVINVLRKMADGWYHGERIRDGQMGWFPANYTSEIVNPHVRARNLKQRYRLLAYSENYLKSN